MRFLGGISETIWDKENNCPLVKFNEGVFETDDPKLIKILKDKKYKTLDEIEASPTANLDFDPKQAITEDTAWQMIQKIAAHYKVAGRGMNRDQLVDAINEARLNDTNSNGS